LSSDARELEPGDPRTLADGRYTCLSVLGEGSMGRTFLADDSKTGSQLAIKALYPSRLADWKDLELFQREAAVLERIEHPLVPRYIDSFHEGEGDSVCYFLAQTWVDGHTLREELRGARRFEEADLVALLRDMLDVLKTIPGLKSPAIHRDIKPENIILRKSDGRPTLVDFGAVREVVRLTMRGGSTIVGSFGYMSPEQLMGRAIPATDIYGLGITMVECLTRSIPQDMVGEDVKRLIAGAQISSGLKRVLSRMCAPMLADRYRLASEILEDLDGLTSGQMVHLERIESDMAQRGKAQERALKKASGPSIHPVLILVISFIVAAIAMGTYYLGQALAVGFESGVLIAVAVGISGLLLTTIMVGMRYVSDAWSPPMGDWLVSQATVGGVREYVSQESNRVVVWEVFYSFPVRGAVYEHARPIPEEIARQLKQGRQFRVWYPAGKPELHEAEDFTKSDTTEMYRLFNPNVVHTPE